MSFCLSVDSISECHSVKTMQYGVLKLYKCVVEITVKDEFGDGCGLSEGARSWVVGSKVRAIAPSPYAPGPHLNILMSFSMSCPLLVNQVERWQEVRGEGQLGDDSQQRSQAEHKLWTLWFMISVLTPRPPGCRSTPTVVSCMKYEVMPSVRTHHPVLLP